MNIKGEYSIRIPIITMFLNTELKITRKNLITRFGESFFMNRCINDYFNPIQYICLGNGLNLPRKSDSSLGNETSRQKCSSVSELDNNQIHLSAKFKAKEVLGTSEIGVMNDIILISHDSYPKLSEDDLVGLVGDVIIDYFFKFNSGVNKSGWEKANDGEHIYYVAEENIVTGVFENDIHGYRHVNSIDSLNHFSGAYYYDVISKNLYIRTTDNSSPNLKEITIMV